MPRSAARVRNSERCSTFSGLRGSYPPAMIRGGIRDGRSSASSSSSPFSPYDSSPCINRAYALSNTETFFLRSNRFRLTIGPNSPAFARVSFSSKFGSMKSRRSMGGYNTVRYSSAERPAAGAPAEVPRGDSSREGKHRKTSPLVKLELTATRSEYLMHRSSMESMARRYVRRGSDSIFLATPAAPPPVPPPPPSFELAAATPFTVSLVNSLSGK
mmetsp:Transcript_43539/g.132501  ORF Transcript_43539/g.132501 Transcript_43539/m.132501 type:complete len:215 (-) Transcript_43539:615-1259(-)